MSNEAVCRTALATPGLLMTVVTEVVIVTYFSKKQLDTPTTDEIFSGQLFTILAMFLAGMASLTTPPNSGPAGPK